MLGTATRLARRFLRHASVFVVLLLCLFTSVLVAQPPAPARSEAETFWALNKWYVLVAVTTFLVQALLIIWLLITQARRRQAETESHRLATFAEQEHKRLDEVVSNVPGIVWEARVDPITYERRTTFISDYVEKMLGYTKEEWMSTPNFALSIVHDEDRDRVQRQAASVFTGAGPTFLKFRWIARDEHILWVEARIAALFDESGKVVGIRGVTLDVTQQHLAEEAKRQSDERFAKAFKANRQPMSVTTMAEGRYIEVNDSFLEMSGYTREEVIGHTSLELNIWESPSHRAYFIQQLKQRNCLVNFETRFRTKEGSLRVLLSSAEELELAGEQCLLVSSSDITERVAIQQALRESEARFRNLADTAPVMIWLTGVDKKCTYLNKQWLEFTGRNLEEQLGGGWADGIHADDYRHTLENYETHFDERKPFEMEYRLRRYDGEFRWIFDAGAPRLSNDGTFLGYIGTCLDITERKESEVKVQKAHEELQQLKNQLEAENIYLQQELQLDPIFGEIVGQSDAIKYVLFKLTQVAPTDTTVLITGETGTGKELVARAIHGASSRKDRPLIKVNCGALAPSLIESELFGHEKGAFTGAGSRKLGRFELASGGTIFLDEIGELPLELQVKLLRVIQENEFERLGGARTIKIDVRIIAATNRNLKLEVENGKFREDLWYRLNVYPITVPPLRQRKEDISLLVEHFVRGYAKKFGKTITSVSPRALQTFQAHSWPGNVRELANAIERAVIHAKGTVLHSVDRFEETSEEPPFAAKTLEDVERDHIIRTLENTGWRIEGPHGAANVLGLNPSTLRTRMSKLGITRRNATVA
ncbi:MAG TPA: sigma 54-interacting transcriptional regulator [Pyrinomonadaceae bacterium]|nr:sigma 54-interacting transcriptional regulator [Pyrinomonadaceae bacterium]